MGGFSGCYDTVSCGGPQGATGATGCMGPQGESFSPVYLSATQEGSVNKGSVSVGDLVTIPFSSVDYAQGISLDSASDTFTLPKGVYTVQFQFMTDDKKILFDPIYLDIGGSQLALSRAAAVYDPDNSLADFSGSTIFEVLENDTEVKLCAKILAASGDLIFTNPNNIDPNNPVRIVFQKIGDLT